MKNESHVYQLRTHSLPGPCHLVSVGVNKDLGMTISQHLSWSRMWSPLVMLSCCGPQIYKQATYELMKKPRVY